MDGEKVFILWSGHPASYSLLQDLLISEGWKVITAAQDDTLWKYVDDFGEKVLVCLGIFDALDGLLPSSDALEKFYLAGNSMIVCAGDRQSKISKLNRLVVKFGINFNQDCIIRPNPYEHYHPKDALLEEFIANRGLSESVQKFIKSRKDQASDDQATRAKSLLGLECGAKVLYAQGCTLSLLDRSMSSTIMMTSSKWAIPARQAICTFHRSSESGCRLIALGSSSMFSDLFLGKEDNKPLFMSFLEFVTNENFTINMSDARTIKIAEPIYGPDIERLIDMPIPSLKKPEPLPEDKSALVDERLFSIDTSLVPTIKRAFRDLKVPHEPLTLIKPDFHLKQLSLQPATHGFLLRRPPVERQIGDDQSN